MAQPSAGWREQVVPASEEGRGALLALLLAVAFTAVACTRAEAPPPAPPAPGPHAGTVVMETQPPGLEVVADGTVRCRAPCSFPIEPGLHRLSIRKAGYMPWQESVEVRPSAELKLSVALVSSH